MEQHLWSGAQAGESAGRTGAHPLLLCGLGRVTCVSPVPDSRHTGRFSLPDLISLGFSTEISDPQARQVLLSSQWNLRGVICLCRYLRLFDKFGSCGWVLGGEPDLGLCCRV